MSQSNPVYSMTYHKPEKLVELIWLPGTQSMTDQDFKDTLAAFAECALQHRANCLTIDMREFRHRPGPEVQAFRDEVIVPKYAKAGVKKLAWIWPGQSGDWTTETPIGNYQNRYFNTVDEAFNWLSAKG
jgi:hypothetical protein